MNTLGVTSTAAFNAVNRTDDFAIVPEQNMAHAMSSVMAQNVGAHKEDRVKKAFRCGIAMELVFGVSIGLLLGLFSEQIMRLFSADPDVIREGTGYLRLIAFMYPFPALTNGIQGYFRGTGDLKITLISSIVNMTVRCISCYVLLFTMGLRFEVIPWSYLAGWVGMCVFEVPFLIRRLGRNA